MSDTADSAFAHLPPPPAPPWWTTPPPGARPSLPRHDGNISPRSAHERAHRIEIDIRNLVLGLGVLCLIAAATTFTAMHWDSINASARAAMLVVVTVGVGGASVETSRRGLDGTATALRWLLMVLCFVDLAALGNASNHVWSSSDETDAAAFAAIGGTTLFVVFTALARLGWGAAMRVGATLAWLLAWFSAFSYWGVMGPDVWVLPVAAVVGRLQWTSTAHDPAANSWSRYGLGLLLTAGFAVPTALSDPNLLRPLVVLSLALSVLIAGLVLRHLAAVWVGGLSIAALVGVQMVDYLRSVPGWMAFALVGVALLGAGIVFEFRLRRAGVIVDEAAPEAARKVTLSDISDWPGLS